MDLNFNMEEFGQLKQWAAIVLGGLVVTAALHFTMFKNLRQENATAQQALDVKLRENAELQAYKPKLAEIERQLASLKQQMEIEARIVPDEKEVDGFIKMMNAEALKAGVEIRRYKAKAMTPKDYYSELPFDMDIDGPYYSMLNFFDHVSKLERIVNISALLVSTVKKPNDAKVGHIYNYAPSESIVATCTATTYFSHDLAPPTGTPAKK
jgi:type IV pilus assembly protein PilO